MHLKQGDISSSNYTVKRRAQISVFHYTLERSHYTIIAFFRNFIIPKMIFVLHSFMLFH